MRPRSELDGAPEVLVDRRRDECMLGRSKQAARADMQPGNDAGEKNDPRWVHLPLIAPREALDDGAFQLVGRCAIAEYPVLYARGERVENRRRRAKIGVGDPERDDVAPGVAVPPQAAGSGTVDRGVEIHFFCGRDNSSFSSSSSPCCSCGL